MNLRSTAAIAGAVLVAFTAFSLWVVARDGSLGFLALAGREPWALQMLIDLVLALVVATGWMMADARRRRINAWPFLAVSIALGSIGVLAYLVRRGLIREPA